MFFFTADAVNEIGILTLQLLRGFKQILGWEAPSFSHVPTIFPFCPALEGWSAELRGSEDAGDWEDNNVTIFVITANIQQDRLGHLFLSQLKEPDQY